MRFSLMLVFSMMMGLCQAQQSAERKGLVFGFAVGAGSIQLSAPSRQDIRQMGPSFPNFKIGKMISSRTALLVCLPGTVHSYQWSGRKRDRGFEGVIPSVQFWAKDRWWLLGGVGLTLDAPAFYDIKEPSERKFYFGPSIIAGTGIEIWRKGKFALDVQGRVHYGSANTIDGLEKGLSFNVLIGCNWR